MKKERWLMLLVGALAGAALTAAGVAAAGGVGSQSDPLVTMSYLNDTFMGQLMEKVDAALAARDKELSDKLAAQIAQDKQALAPRSGSSAAGGASGAAAEAFAVVTLTQGQTLRGTAGCEVMLRVGTAVCVAASAPGLIDETDASTLAGGEALARNHLYMATIAERGVQATAATVKLLVRGEYSIV